MKLLKLIVLALSLSVMNTYAQELVVEDLPVATINDNFYVTLPEMDVMDDYYVDISGLTFADEDEAIYLLTSFVTGNLVTSTIHYSEGYMIVHIHKEYISGTIALSDMQYYLDHLSKPEGAEPTE